MDQQQRMPVALDLVVDPAAVDVEEAGLAHEPSERRKASTASTRLLVSGDWSIPSLRKICFTCASTVRSVMKSRRPISTFDIPSATSGENLALAFGELVEGIGLAAAREEPGDDRRIDHCLAFGQPPERIDEDRGIADAVLEQVARPLGMLLEQPHRETRLDVVREHEDADVRVELANALRRDDPLVRVRRRHADVDDHTVGPGRRDIAHQAVDLARLADHLDAGAGEDADDPLSGQHHVIRDHDTHPTSLPRHRLVRSRASHNVASGVAPMTAGPSTRRLDASS